MRSRRTWAVVSTALLLAAATACGGNDATTNGSPSAHDTSSSTPPGSTAQITSSIPTGATGVRVNRSIRLNVSHGTFSNVAVRTKGVTVKGALSADKLTWQSTDRLQPGQVYRVSGTAADASGNEQTYASTFTTQKLGLKKQTFPSFFPTSGSTVGVAMPVVIRFDVPVTDHASFQQHISVTSSPAQSGAFHWISDTELHWRPQNYWKADTKVTVDADVDSIPAGNGVFGQTSRTSHFTIGRRQVLKVDTTTDQMKVIRDGVLIRTLPVTTGEQPEFTTRSGTKVIVEKDRRHDMNSETIGIDPNGPEGYNLKGVEFAMRLTYSGEFIHAAPWSVASQGHANVSHGCTGMSTENAGWLYNNTMIGDPVVYTGTSKPMTLTNGLGDWNLPFDQYAQKTAL
ncbi:MAG TPA: Ig-like domain-containing protein [Marmoricola sp.]|jgi:lipoprotein-anchoring transpeptidase ErfK/SrfK|nr:Ig-like domain-containing protein [Marmoricola sp.]